MKAIASKLVQLMSSCTYIQKDKRNSQQGYNYASAAVVLERVSAAMVEIVLCSAVNYEILSQEQIVTAKGATMQLVTVACKLTIIDPESGETLQASGIGSGSDSLDKAVAKAQTMALKYAWLSTLNISTGDDPEDDSGTLHEVATSTKDTGQVDKGVKTIRDLWNAQGWETANLEPYVEKRMGKTLDQLNLAETRAFYKMLRDYIAQQPEVASNDQ